MDAAQRERIRRLARCGAAMMVSLAGSAASAQPQNRAPDTRRAQIPVALDRIDQVYLSPHGVVPGPFTGPVGRSCNMMASHTDANFSGGSFIVQAGFAQNEMAGMTYTVPAGEWPIKINMTEFIIATAGTNQTTTTKWSLLYYQGTPTDRKSTRLNSSH